MDGKWVVGCAMPQHMGIAKYMPPTAGTTTKSGLVNGLDGEAFRLVLAEFYSAEAVQYGRVVVETEGRQAEVLFDGEATVAVPPGEMVVSDTVQLPVKKGGLITVWLYNRGPGTSLSVGSNEQIHSGPGDFCGKAFAACRHEPKLPQGMHSGERHTGIAGLHVFANPEADAIVAFGDSITAMGHWVEPLRRGLAARLPDTVLVNCGISGNRLLRDTNLNAVPGVQIFGRAGITRMKWDLLRHPGVKVVLMALGINDIAQPGEGPTNPPLEERCGAQELVEGYSAFIQAAHAAGIKVIGCTITPFGGYKAFCEETETTRKRVNDWILNSGQFDATIDFAQAVCDPARPAYLLAAHDSGDSLHPGPQGGEAMAAAIDIAVIEKLL